MPARPAVGPAPVCVSRASAQFFLGWVGERESRLHLANARQPEEALAELRETEHFWAGKAAQANAD
jgi:hypothetical protein